MAAKAAHPSEGEHERVQMELCSSFVHSTRVWSERYLNKITKLV
jgi:hypothetical protein